jgi:hypothetical protein
MTLDTRYFALAVRAIGLVVLAFAAPDAVSMLISIAGLVKQAVDPGTTWSLVDMGWSYAPATARVLAEAAIGIYLLRGGGAIARYCVRVSEFSCPACGYDLRDVQRDLCPECGCVNVLRVGKHNGESVS